MKFTGVLFIILGVLLLLVGIACLFASTSPVVMGGSIVLSIVFNAIGATMLTTKTKK